MSINNLPPFYVLLAEPTDPVITQSPNVALKEGDSVTYTCTSMASPPPKLEFSYGYLIPQAELSHNPPVDNITDDSGEETSTLIWTTTANKNMNDKSLQCTIVGHPAGTRAGSKSMAVYCKCLVCFFGVGQI